MLYELVIKWIISPASVLCTLLLQYDDTPTILCLFVYSGNHPLPLTEDWEWESAFWYRELRAANPNDPRLQNRNSDRNPTPQKATTDIIQEYWVHKEEPSEHVKVETDSPRSPSPEPTSNPTNVKEDEEQ